MDFAVWIMLIGTGEDEVEEIVIHNVKSADEAAFQAGEIMSAEFSGVWHIFDTIPAKPAKRRRA